MLQWMYIVLRNTSVTARLSTSLGLRYLSTRTLASSVGNRLNNRPKWCLQAYPRVDAVGDFALRSRRRHFSFSNLPTILVPPTIFVGLLVTLWTYKCLMMVLFQNKIIYMPSIPPFSRSEKIRDYAADSSPVVWEEKRIKSLDGTPIALCIGQLPSPREGRSPSRHVAILYFQGLV